MALTIVIIKLVLCLSVQIAIGVDFYGTDDSTSLQYPYDVPELNNDAEVASTLNQNEEVCDKAITLQKILGVMISMLSQDLSESSKAMYILDTLKDLLKKTPGYNNEVLQKIDDLMLTLDKYKAKNNKPDDPITQSFQLTKNLKLGYELPALTNTYCTEALQSIIRIAYQAYASLAKNPICNLPALPALSSVKPENQLVPDYFNPVSPGLDLQPAIWDGLLPKQELPSQVPDYNFPVGYKPYYEYLPEPYQSSIDGSKTPSSPLLFPPGPILYPTDDTNSRIPLRPYPSQNLNVLSLDHAPPNPINAIIYPYNNPVAEPYPETKTPEFIPYPFDAKPLPHPIHNNLPDANNPVFIPKVPVSPSWGDIFNAPSKETRFPFPNSLKNIGEAMFEYPLPINKKTKRPYNPSIETPEYIPFKPYSDESDDNPPNESDVFEISYEPASGKPDVYSFDYIPPNPINSVYPYNQVVFEPNPETNSPSSLKDLDANNPLNIQKFPMPSPWGERPDLVSLNPRLPFPNSQNISPQGLFSEYPSPGWVPESEHPENFPLDPYYSYSDNANFPSEPDVFAFPFETSTPKLKNLSSNLFPVDSQINHANNPSAAVGYNSEASLSPYNQYLKSTAYPPSLNLIPETPPAINPQNFNPLFPQADTPLDIFQGPDSQVLEFIDDAIAFVEKTIPVGQFDEPTLHIIAKLTNLLGRNDLEIDDYATILNLYTQLFNYIKQLNIHKEIIDLLDLSRVTNDSKLKANKVVELTYLVKRPRPVVYHPYYYVKYRLPYQPFMKAAQKLLREKPTLRTNPHQLYKQLLDLSKVVETSPDLENYNKKDIVELTSGSGSLIDAQLIRENGIHLRQDGTNSETVKKDASYQNGINSFPRKELISKPVETVKSDQGKQQPENSSTPNPLLRQSKAQNKTTIMKPSTEKDLELTSFHSNKMRSDILRGENVEIPFSDYSVANHWSPLNSLNDPKPKDESHFVPAMNKLFDATLDASRLREAKQQNLMNSGLIYHDYEKIDMNKNWAVTQPSSDYWAHNKDELAKFTKNAVKENIRQFYNTVPSTGERNKQYPNEFSYHNNMRPISDGFTWPHSNHDISNTDPYKFLEIDRPKNHHQPLADVNQLGRANQDRIKLNTNAELNSKPTQNAVSFNFNQYKLYRNPDFGHNQGIDNFDFDAGAAGQESYGGIGQQNVVFDSGLASQQAASQQNIAEFGTEPILADQQIQKDMFRFPVDYKHRVIQRLPVMSSATPFLDRYSSGPLLG